MVFLELGPPSWRIATTEGSSEHDAFAPHVNQRIGRTQVNRHVV